MIDGNTGMSALRPQMNGAWYVVPTAFTETGEIDLASQRRLVESCVEWGVRGVTVLGVMGESGALDDAERRAVLESCVSAAGGRVPVLAGCSAAAAALVRRRMSEAAALGAAGAMVSAPPLHKNTASLPLFFEEVSAASGLPIVVQDEPAATGVVVSASVLLEICERTAASVVKLEDPPTAPKISALLERSPDLSVFGGLGGVAALGELRAGACGTMTGFAFPEILAAVHESHTGGATGQAAQVFDSYLPLIQFEAQPGIGLGIRKELLCRRGVLQSNFVRNPVGRISPFMSRELDDVLRRVGIMPPSDGKRLVLPVSGRIQN